MLQALENLHAAGRGRRESLGSHRLMRASGMQTLRCSQHASPNITTAHLGKALFSGCQTSLAWTPCVIKMVPILHVCLHVCHSVVLAAQLHVLHLIRLGLVSCLVCSWLNLCLSVCNLLLYFL